MALSHLLVLWFLVLGEIARTASGNDTLLDRKTSLSSTSYICKENFYLNVTFLRSIFVLDPLHCAFECSKTDKCFSVNLEAVRNTNGYFSCELLPSSMVNHFKQLKSISDYHHYEFKVSGDLAFTTKRDKCPMYSENVLLIYPRHFVSRAYKRKR